MAQAPNTGYYHNNLDLSEYFEYDASTNAAISTGFYAHNSNYPTAIDLGHIFKLNVSGLIYDVSYTDMTNTMISTYFEAKLPYSILSGDLPTQLDHNFNSSPKTITIGWFSTNSLLISNIQFRSFVSRIDFAICGGGGGGGTYHINCGGGGGGGGQVYYSENEISTMYFGNTHSFNIWSGAVGDTGNNGNNSHFRSDNLFYNYNVLGGDKGGDCHPDTFPINYWISGSGGNSTYNGGSGGGGYSNGYNEGWAGGGGGGSGGVGGSSLWAANWHDTTVAGCPAGIGTTCFGYELGKGGQGGAGHYQNTYSTDGETGSCGAVIIKIYF